VRKAEHKHGGRDAIWSSLVGNRKRTSDADQEKKGDGTIWN